MKTPEGIRIGSTFKQVKKAYPRLYKIMQHEDGGTYRVDKIPGSKIKQAYYDFSISKGKVVAFKLGVWKQNCYE